MYQVIPTYTGTLLDPTWIGWIHRDHKAWCADLVVETITESFYYLHKGDRPDNNSWEFSVLGPIRRL